MKDALRRTVWVDGMIGENSELLVEQELGKLAGVTEVHADSAEGTVTFCCGQDRVGSVLQALERLGYPVKEQGDGQERSTVVRVSGMTCTGCESILQRALGKLKGVTRVHADFTASTVSVSYDPSAVTPEQIWETIEKQGYGVAAKPGTARGKNDEEGKMPASQLIAVGLILLALYLIIQNTVGFNFIPEVSQNMGYGLLFVVGLLTSLHCVAMCGGIALSQSVAHREEQAKAQKWKQVRPSLLYNAGRVVSYTIVGGIVGALGSAVSFSGTAKGIIAILSGVFMVLMGLNIIGLFPALRKFMPRMPKVFGRKLGGISKHGPFFIGLLNGLMPCGPLQAMQIYALGTGSFFAGAASMFVFSLGTVPLMFGFGAVSSLLSSKFTHKMMKVSAALVMVLGVVMLSRGFALSGVNLIPSVTAQAASGSVSVAKLEGNVQTVTTSLDSGRYAPIIVQKGVPVKWVVKAENGTVNGCNRTMTIPKYNVTKTLAVGDNEVTFTPQETGTIPYTCWMGMISSNITVVDDLSTVSQNDVAQAQSNTVGTAGGGCCAGGAAVNGTAANGAAGGAAGGCCGALQQ